MDTFQATIYRYFTFFLMTVKYSKRWIIHSYHHTAFSNTWTVKMDPCTYTSCPLISVTRIPRKFLGQMKHFQIFKIFSLNKINFRPSTFLFPSSLCKILA